MIAPKSYGDNYKSAFDTMYLSLSKEYDLNYIPFLLDGVALNPDLNLNDGIHPNEKGVIIISKTIIRQIKKIIKRKKLLFLKNILDFLKNNFTKIKKYDTVEPRIQILFADLISSLLKYRPLSISKLASRA